MAQCIQFVNKETNEPEVRVHIDAKICEHFGVPVHPTKWFREWYPVIGFDAALGRSYAEIRASLVENEADDEPWLVPVLDWLEQHYVLRAWAE